VSRITSLTGTFEKRVNDGDYGNERCELSATVDLEDDDHDAEMVAANVLRHLRALVVDELLRSENLRIRRALKPEPRLCSECHELLGDADDFVHETCREERKAKQQAEEDARRERWKAPVIVGTTVPGDREEIPF